MIELKKTVFKFKYDEKVYELKAPTVRDIEGLQKSMKGKEEGSIEETINFLDGLGLPKEVAYSMEASNLEKIVTAVSGTKNA